MMRIIILYWLFVFSLHSFAQDCSGKIPQSHIDRMNNRILRNFQEAKYCPIDSVVLIDIIDVGYPLYGNMDKRYFEDGSFLSDIIPSYYRPIGKLRKVIDAYAILFNESNNFVVLADYFDYYDQGSFGIYHELAKLIVQNRIKCIYHLAGVFWGGIYIGIGTDGLIFLINAQFEHAIIWNLKDFPADEWNSVFFDSYLEKRGLK